AGGGGGEGEGGGGGGGGGGVCGVVVRGRRGSTPSNSSAASDVYKGQIIELTNLSNLFMLLKLWIELLEIY
ncbi:hypothetical protein, partial [Mesomycoplasma hyorhinis]|uniref:hypothetical protein n=1 Tax=Mesomycoplasma hyorhinis TaxID=2100 RepID=UPI001C0491C6